METQVEENIKKSNTNSLAIIVIIVLVIVGGFIAFINLQKNATKTTQPSVKALPKEVQVVLTSSGFDPESVTIEKGSAVRWVNDTEDKATVNSDDHPTHKEFKELNLGEFENDSTLVHIFTTLGTYTYHDHLHPTRKGTVIVR